MGIESKPVVAFLSFRLLGTDGVSIVAKSWQLAFEQLGWVTITIAGEGPVDRLVPGLEIDAELPPDRPELEAALHGVDLVVVENLLTIPMNLPASAMVASVLQGRRTILHHHDPPWQRSRFAHVTELPAKEPEGAEASWVHVTINKLTEQEFADRGIAAHTIYNGFNPNPASGDRERTRATLGVSDEESLIAHPVRAIARKGIEEAIRLAEQLGATYWLTGPAEEGYRPVLDRLFAEAECRIIHQLSPAQADIYAAADLIVFPSLWEGFGNPPIEAAIHGRPVAVSHYPVADELRLLGFDWPDLGQIDELRSELANPDPDRIAHNKRVVCDNLGTDEMRNQLQQLLKQAGWSHE